MTPQDKVFQYNEDLRHIYRNLPGERPIVVFCHTDMVSDVGEIIQRYGPWVANPTQRENITVFMYAKAMHERIDVFAMCRDLREQAIPFTLVNASRRTSENFMIARFHNGRYSYDTLDYSRAVYPTETVLEMLKAAALSPIEAARTRDVLRDELLRYYDKPFTPEQVALSKRERMARLVMPKEAKWSKAVEQDSVNQKIWGRPHKITDMF